MASMRSVFLLNRLYCVHPNVYTAFRILGIIPFLGLIISKNFTAALAFFCLLAITDFLDGHVARATGRESDFGKFFDPLADKIFLLAALLMLLPRDFWSGTTLWLGISLFVLETMLFVTAWLAYRFPERVGRALGANSFGKWKAVSEIILVLLLLGGRSGFLAGYYLPVGGMVLVILFYAALSLIYHWQPVVENMRRKKPTLHEPR